MHTIVYLVIAWRGLVIVWLGLLWFGLALLKRGLVALPISLCGQCLYSPVWDRTTASFCKNDFSEKEGRSLSLGTERRKAPRGVVGVAVTWRLGGGQGDSLAELQS